MWYVGPHLPVNGDEPTLIDRNAGVLGSDELAVRSATNCDENPVEAISGRSTAALEMYGKPLPVRFDFRDLRFEVDGFILLCDALHQWRDNVLIGARDDLVHELDHRHLGTERMIDGCHL